MTEVLRDEMQWLWGLVEDTLNLGRNRKLAEEVRILAELSRNRREFVDSTSRGWNLLDSLERARRCLSETPSAPGKRPTIEFEYGTRPAPDGLEEPAIAPEEMPFQEPIHSSAAYSAIELCDWLDRVHEGDISAERGIEVATCKAEDVLTALEIARINRTGAYDERDQQIVDTVATGLANADMTVCATVQCGYRTKDRMIRPQRVMVYRFAAEPSQNRATDQSQ